MEKIFADIIVDISHEALDRTFQYKIPIELRDSVEIGSFVKIPFGKGNKEIGGYILDITDKANYDEAKLKSIISVDTNGDLVEEKLIKLGYFIKKNYGSTMITALKTVLPIKKTVKEKQLKTVVLLLDEESAKEKLDFYECKHQTARYRLLKELIEEHQIEHNIVTTKLNISPATLKVMEEQGVIKIQSERVYRNQSGSFESNNKPVLNDEQKAIADSIIFDIKESQRNHDNNILDEKNDNTFLIRGVTGSGKTEIYMEVIDSVISLGRQVIVLIPEIALTYQTVMRFKKRYGDRVSTLHSKLSLGERYDQFERAKKGEIDVMIGPRSALFTPFRNLGLIVIDEEHESSYKSDKMPKYHAREVAHELARLHNAAVILGSATPSIESFYRAKNNEIKLFEIDKRAKASSLAKAEIIDLREELKAGNTSMFSRLLKEKIEDRLLKKQQVMLFLNRRGYAGFVSCRICGHVFKCPHCDVSLSLHGKNRMVCHYCGYETGSVKICPECGSPYVGTMKAGTEQVEESVKNLFPYASVLRMDADTTKTKDSYENILSAFANKEADILIGTQMIVKGHDFPDVTLVGILAADMSLHVNDYRAAERTFQLITQAAGRAGRSSDDGEVIIQTYSPDNYSIISAAKQDYNAFYNEEISYRDLLSYPPVGHMLAVLIEATNENLGEKTAHDLAESVKNGIIDRNLVDKVRIVGPAKATIQRINDIYRNMIYIKSKDYERLTEIKDLIESVFEKNPNQKNLRITFDFDPLNGY